jgi:hypothetical protein
MRHVVLPAAVTALLLALAGAAAAAAAPEPAAPPSPPPADAPVTDPVCVGWDKACVVYRYSAAAGKWGTFKGPRAALPLLVTAAVGPSSAAALDPEDQYSGWLFDLHAEKWAKVPPSPIEGRGITQDAAPVVFVGAELVVWAPRPGPSRGAVLDTRTMTWRRTAEAPVAPRNRCLTAVVGDRVVYWGGYGPYPVGGKRTGPAYGPLADGAVYDVRRDAWEKIPDPPVPVSTYGLGGAAWNGRLVLVGGKSRDGAQTWLTYDPAARTWEKMADCRYDLGLFPTCAVNGNRLFVWSGSPPAARNEAAASIGAVYDFKKRTWDTIPEAPIPPRSGAYARPQGAGGIIVWGGWDARDVDSLSLTDGATYDVDARQWRKIEPMPAAIPPGFLTE